MCARRFLIAVFILTLIAVAGAFAIYQWGGQVLVSQATPKGHFVAAAAGVGPNYARLDAWISRPGLSGNDVSRWLPAGLAPEGGSPDAAVFYVHPTTYLERDRWNAPLRPGGETEARTQLFTRSQASAFNGSGQIWAPRYRQAAFAAFLLRTADATRALDLAYGDVRAAFDAFLKANPKGPLILAGHSQGSLHLLRLMAERKDQLAGRLVAAYIVGWPVGIRSDLPATGFPACASPDQVGCVLGWQSFAQPANTSLVTGAWIATRGLTGAMRTRSDILCVDPVSGRQNSRSEARDNPGTLVPTADLSSAMLTPGLVSSRCERGFLIVGGAIPAMGPYILPGNNYHVYDYALFWAAVRRDAARRLAAWRR